MTPRRRVALLGAALVLSACVAGPYQGGGERRGGWRDDGLFRSGGHGERDGGRDRDDGPRDRGGRDDRRTDGDHSRRGGRD